MQKLYEKLVHAIIRPPRHLYRTFLNSDVDEDLGPQVFALEGRCYRRNDFTLRNKKNQRIECSLFEALSRNVSDEDDDGTSNKEIDYKKNQTDKYGNKSNTYFDKDLGLEMVVSGNDVSTNNLESYQKFENSSSSSANNNNLYGKTKNKKKKPPIVIFLHSNSGSRLQAIPCLPSLLPLGISVCCFDFSGSGLSQGEFISLGWHESGDLDIVLEHLEKLGYSDIGLWGRSMGAAVCVMHGSKAKARGFGMNNDNNNNTANANRTDFIFNLQNNINNFKNDRNGDVSNQTVDLDKLIKQGGIENNIKMGQSLDFDEVADAAEDTTNNSESQVETEDENDPSKRTVFEDDNSDENVSSADENANKTSCRIRGAVLDSGFCNLRLLCTEIVKAQLTIPEMFIGYALDFLRGSIMDSENRVRKRANSWDQEVNNLENILKEGSHSAEEGSVEDSFYEKSVRTLNKNINSMIGANSSSSYSQNNSHSSDDNSHSSSDFRAHGQHNPQRQQNESFGGNPDIFPTVCSPSIFSPSKPMYDEAAASEIPDEDDDSASYPSSTFLENSLNNNLNDFEAQNLPHSTKNIFTKAKPSSSSSSSNASFSEKMKTINESRTVNPSGNNSSSHASSFPSSQKYHPNQPPIMFVAAKNDNFVAPHHTKELFVN